MAWEGGFIFSPAYESRLRGGRLKPSEDGKEEIMKLRTLALAIFTLGVLFPWSNSAFAGDVSIKSELGVNIQQAMKRFIDEGTVDGVYRHYDPVTGKILRLEFIELKSKVLKKGDFYVSCCNFKDHRGRPVDLDLLVIQDGDYMRGTQAAVHKLPGDKERRSRILIRSHSSVEDIPATAIRADTLWKR